jgi:GWxTD domain-containing protein
MAGVLILLLVVSPIAALKKKWPDSEEIFNPLLGPATSHWLVGPIYHMASDAEVEEYQLLSDDEEAKKFIAAFWKERNAGTKVFTETPEQIFQKRAEKADKEYTEGAVPGQHTDRGTVLILYGEPEDVEYESPRSLGGPTLEAWIYPKDGTKGLDGEVPKKRFRFVKIGTETVLYTGQKRRRDPREELKRRPRY